jgi:Tfp pilus assembly protein PilE
MNLLNAFSKKKKKKINFQLFTPENTIASFIELPAGTNPLEAIWHTSSVALDTEQICFIYSLSDDGVYFIAAPALTFLHKKNTTSPLAAALPGNEQHQGDGAYICPIGSSLYAVAIKGVESLSCYIGDKATVLQFAANQPQFWIETNNQPWYSLTQYKQQETVTLMTQLSIVSLVGILACAALSSFFAYQNESYLASQRTQLNNITQLEQKNLLILNANRENNTGNQVLHKYLEVSSYVLSQQGSIVSFDYKGNHLKYVVQLPQTTTNLNPTIKNDLIIIEKEETL